MRETLKSEIASNMKSAWSLPTFAVWAAAIAIAVLSGPFNTFEDLGLLNRTLFWGLVISASVLIGYVARAIAVAVAGEDHPLRFDSFAAVCMAILITPTIWVIGHLFEPMFMFNETPIYSIFLFALSISAILFFVRRLIPGIERRPYAFADLQKDDTATKRASPRLVKRLPESMGRDVLRISAKDHHVEVATRLGKTSLRMRFNDAIAEMDPVQGQCVHRSHWIARSAVDEVDRENAQKTWLVLKNGDRVPVSRKYRSDLENAGIL